MDKEDKRVIFNKKFHILRNRLIGKSHIFLFVLCILISYILCCCSTAPQSIPSCSDRRLQISAANNEYLGFTTISSEQLGGNYSGDIVYFNLDNVTIDIEGTRYPLETAIHDRLISVEEIIAYTRIDARNGICTESYITNHSLTQFTYTYPEYEIRITYDIFKSPTGKEHLISDLGIYMVGSDIFTGYKDDETGEAIDREDWGITFDITDVTTNSLSLTCNQTGGQHIGELYIDCFGLYRADGSLESVQKNNGGTPAIEPKEKITIKNANTTDITLEWEKEYGSLPSGKYKMYLYIADFFDVANVHPLMEDFKTEQIYWIEFKIP